MSVLHKPRSLNTGQDVAGTSPGLVNPSQTPRLSHVYMQGLAEPGPWLLSARCGTCHPCHIYPLACGLCLPMPPWLCALQKCPISLRPACVCLRAGGCPVLDRWVHGRWTAGCVCSLSQLLGATCRHTVDPGEGAFGNPGMACLPSPTFPRTPWRRPILCLPPAMPQS